MKNETNGKFKPGLINYLDVIVAVMNFMIIIIPMLFFYENVFISIIGIFISGVLIVFALSSLASNNPFYIYYCYGLMINSIFFIFPAFIMIPWLGLLFLPNFIFLYQLSKKRSQHAATNIIARSARAGNLGLMIRNLDQKYDNINPDLEIKRKQQRDIVENLYKGKKILRLTFLFSIALFVVFVLFSLTYFA